MKSFEQELLAAKKEINYLAQQWSKNVHVQADDLLELDDIKQEISIAMLSAYNSYKENKSITFRTYYSNVINNHMVDITRRTNTRIAGEDKELVWQEGLDNVDDYEEAEDTLDRVTLVGDVAKVLRDTLSERDYTAVALYFGIGYGSPSSYKEVSEYLRMPRRTVADIIARVLNNPIIKQGLEGDL